MTVRVSSTDIDRVAAWLVIVASSGETGLGRRLMAAGSGEAVPTPFPRR